MFRKFVFCQIKWSLPSPFVFVYCPCCFLPEHVNKYQVYAQYDPVPLQISHLQSGLVLRLCRSEDGYQRSGRQLIDKINFFLFFFWCNLSMWIGCYADVCLYNHVCALHSDNQASIYCEVESMYFDVMHLGNVIGTIDNMIWNVLPYYGLLK